jgi:thiamine-phosphate pyrophosphorylase
MSARCLLYYITDRSALPGDEPARRSRLLEKISEAARAGVDYIQLRERDLPARELESLARQAVNILQESAQLRTENRGPRTALLINSRTDVALAVRANGVHLRADDVLPEDVRAVWKESAAEPKSRSPGQAPPTRGPIVAVSCHTTVEVAQADANGANFAVFAPVFGKKELPETATGLASLAEACRHRIPVLALGGITLQNAHRCVDAGAAGVAAIRLFQENDLAAVVKQLRSNS